MDGELSRLFLSSLGGEHIPGVPFLHHSRRIMNALHFSRDRDLLRAACECNGQHKNELHANSAVTCVTLAGGKVKCTSAPLAAALLPAFARRRSGCSNVLCACKSWSVNTVVFTFDGLPPRNAIAVSRA